jgi:hypothetical protein
VFVPSEKIKTISIVDATQKTAAFDYTAEFSFAANFVDDPATPDTTRFLTRESGGSIYLYAGKNPGCVGTGTTETPNYAALVDVPVFEKGYMFQKYKFDGKNGGTCYVGFVIDIAKPAGITGDLNLSAYTKLKIRVRKQNETGQNSVNVRIVDTNESGNNFKYPTASVDATFQTEEPLYEYTLNLNSATFPQQSGFAVTVADALKKVRSIEVIDQAKPEGDGFKERNISIESIRFVK